MNGIEKAEGLDISEPSAYFIVPDGIRTHGLPLRRRMLYPAELRRRAKAEKEGRIACRNGKVYFSDSIRTDLFA